MIVLRLDTREAASTMASTVPFGFKEERREKREERREKREEGRGKREERREKRGEGRGKREEGKGKREGLERLEGV